MFDFHNSWSEIVSQAIIYENISFGIKNEKMTNFDKKFRISHLTFWTSEL